MSSWQLSSADHCRPAQLLKPCSALQLPEGGIPRTMGGVTVNWLILIS